LSFAYQNKTLCILFGYINVSSCLNDVGV